MTTKITRRNLGALTATAALVATLGIGATTSALAETFPSKPVRFITGFTAGSSIDTVARIIAEGLRTKYNWTVVVETRSGANGQLAATELQNSKPDGYTVLISNSSSITVNSLIYKKLNYDPAKFTPITSVVAVPFVLTLNPENPRLAGVNNVADLIKRAREKPDELMYGSAGVGNLMHLSSALLAASANVKMRHVPFRGAAPMQAAILAKDIDFGFDTTSAVPLVKNGNLKAIAISAAERWHDLPDVPTVAEQGYPGFDVAFWVGTFLPPGAPADIVATYSKAIKEISEDPKYKALLSQQGRINVSTAEKFAENIKTEMQRNAKIVKDANISLD